MQSLKYYGVSDYSDEQWTGMLDYARQAADEVNDPVPEDLDGNQYQVIREMGVGDFDEGEVFVYEYGDFPDTYMILHEDADVEGSICVVGQENIVELLFPELEETWTETGFLEV